MRDLIRTQVRSMLLDGIPGLSHGFTSKEMPKADRIALDAAVTTVKQTHGDGVAWVTAPEKGAREADAVGTFTPGLAVGVYSADCVPVLLAATDASTNQIYGVVAVHGGWRSTALGIAGKAVRELARETEARHPDRRFRVHAAIGPCIRFDHFEVHDDVLNAFPGAEARGLARFVRVEDGRRKYLVNLPGEILRQLRETAGESNATLVADDLDLCTVRLAERFPSYRRRDREAMGGILSFLAFSDPNSVVG